MDDEEKEEYLLRLPTFEDVRVLLDHNDLTGSVDSDNPLGIEIFNGWNELSQRGKFVHKLFRKLRQKINKSQPNIWSSYEVPVSEEFRNSLLKPLSPEKMSKIKKTQPYGEESSSDIKNSSSNNLTNEVVIWHKPEKRKYEKSVEVHGKKNSAKTTAGAYVDRKKPAHLLSSDESELSDSHPSHSASVTDVCELDTARGHGEVSNSTSGRPSTSRLHPSSELSDVINLTDGGSNISSVHEVDSEMDQSDLEVSRGFSGGETKIQRTIVDGFKSQGDGTCPEKICQEHTFTQKDEEEISKFSFLLDEDIVKNNHMWILQCPSTMDCSGLIGQKLDLSGNCNLKVGHRNYEAFTYRSHNSRVATVAVPSHRNQLELKRLPIAGNIIIEDFLDITSDSSYSISETPRRMELPDNLCTRHPLFGKDFNKQLKMAKKVDEVFIKKEFHRSKSGLNEVNDVLESDASYELKKKKKKKRKRESVELSELSIAESDLNSSFRSPKKKKIKQEY